MFISEFDDDAPVDTGPKEAKPKLHVEEVVLRPELSLDQAEDKWLNQRLDDSCVKHRPEVSTCYRTPDGKAKLIFLRDVLDPDIYARAYEHVRNIKYTPASNSRRAALKDSPGGDALFGYKDELQLLPHSGRRQTYPEWTAPSVHQFARFRGLWPLCRNMEDVLREYLPDYWQGPQCANKEGILGYWRGREIGDWHGPAPRGDLQQNEFYKYPKAYQRDIRSWSNWDLFYNIGGSNFTGLSVNHNTIFLAHKDANNSSGALSCLAAFGNFRGGDLGFPRLGVAIDARERDLLVCDCLRELHGTLPLRGTRYSVVAYTKEGLTRAGTGRVLDYKTHEKLWSY